jgi:alpha-2-macroglobulin
MIRAFIFSILSMLLLFSSCSHRGNELTITDRNFEAEVPLTFNFSVKFSHPVAPDSLINEWLKEELISLEPATPLRMRFIENDRLEFTSLQPLLPAADYKLILNEKLVALAGNKIKLDKNAILFHTPYLTVEQASSYWAEVEGSNRAGVYFALQFNYPVNPTEVAERLSIQLDGVKQAVNTQSTQSGTLVTYYVRDVSVEDRIYESEISLAPGLNVSATSKPTTDSWTHKFQLSSPFKLTIDHLSSQHDGITGRLDINTSQPIDVASLQQHLSITPAIEYTIETHAGGFSVVSEYFNVATTYRMFISEGLKGRLGGTLQFDFEETAAFGQLEPGIRFVSQKAYYLSKNGNRNIEARIISIDKVKLSIYKVYQNNITNYLASNYFGYYDDYYYDDWYSSSPHPNQMGDLVHEETLTTANLPKVGGNRLLNFNFSDKVSTYDGLYVVEIRSEDDYWLSARKIVSLSDLGIITRKGPNSVMVFVNSLESTQAVSGVNIKVIGRNNQDLGKGTTNAEGVAEIKLTNIQLEGFSPALITATKSGDFNWLYLNNTEVNTNRFDVGGKIMNATGFDAFLYPERDLYRPGEKIHLAGIVRNKSWMPPGEIPVKVVLKGPNGRELQSWKKTLNESGAFEIEYVLSPASSTGGYSCYLYSANDVVMAYYMIRVEEFVPERIKVDLTLNSHSIKHTEKIEATFKAANLFGPAAANRKYELVQSLSRKQFTSAEYAQYTFDIQSNDRYLDNVIRQGNTNEIGTGNETFSFDELEPQSGILKAGFYLTVFDETGRPVNRMAEAVLYTQEVFFGILQEGYYHKTNQPVRFPLIALDKNGKAINGQKAEVRLIKHEFRTVLSKSGSYFRYRSEKEEKILDQKIVTINGTQTAYNFVPQLSGEYELRLTFEGAANYVSSKFYSYGWGNTSNTSFEVNNEGNIDIEFDQKEYAPGEKAQVICKTPFSGKMLVTVETDRVLKHFYIETDKRSAAFSLDITTEMMPNAYISATLFRPHQESDLPLTVAHGMAPLIVKAKNTRLPVEIEAVAESRSLRKQKVRVKTTPGAQLTIAVVDEGILQVSGFTTPQPYEYFYGKRASQVMGYDLYPYLFPELKTSISLPGGGEGGMAKRLNPISSKRFNLVSYWSGLVKAGSDGWADFSFDIPEFSGSLRVMAVAHKGNSFGSNEKNITVADPIVLSTALPRFMAPGDTVDMKVVLTNTTSKPLSTTIKISADDPFVLAGKAPQSISLKAKAENSFTVKLTTKQATGTGDIKVTAQASGENYSSTTNMAVRPAASLVKKSGSGVVKGGSESTIALSAKDLLKGSASVKLVVGSSPIIEFNKNLDYLLGYPHGCLEQTVSKAFPQLYFDDLLKEMNRNGDGKLAAYHVEQAIQKLQLMQLYNGGFSYWAGSGNENWWSSAFATHFLVEAKKAGYRVDEKMLQYALDYLKNKLKNKNLVDYFYNGTQNKKIAPREVSYSLYVLALAGDPFKSIMNYYRSKTEVLSIDARYLLACSYALIDDQKNYVALLPESFDGEKANPVSGGSFYSYLRDQALALNTLMDVDPNNQQVAILAKHVAEQLKMNKYVSTQESVFGLLALGKMARKNAGKKGSAVVKLNGKEIGKSDGSVLTLRGDEMLSGQLILSSVGEGAIYYFWESEGIPLSGKVEENDSYLRVRRTYFSRDGKPVSGNRFNQHELYVVKITLQSTTNNPVENVAITDLLPAGFEIENQRLQTLPDMKWITKQDFPEYQDIRDDRVNLFTTARKEEQAFYYMVRAISPGTFKLGPVSADAMYAGEYHSYFGSGIVIISHTE